MITTWRAGYKKKTYFLFSKDEIITDCLSKIEGKEGEKASFFEHLSRRNYSKWQKGK